MIVYIHSVLVCRYSAFCIFCVFSGSVSWGACCGSPTWPCPWGSSQGTLLGGLTHWKIWRRGKNQENWKEMILKKHGSGQFLKDSWDHLIFQKFMYWIYTYLFFETPSLSKRTQVQWAPWRGADESFPKSSCRVPTATWFSLKYVVASIESWKDSNNCSI